MAEYSSDQLRMILAMSADITSLQRSLKKASGDTATASKQMQTSLTNIGPKTNPFAGLDRNAQNSARNLTFQLNDITSTLLSGSSPFMVMAQQGSQVTQALQGMAGSGSVFRTLGQAALQFANPLSLAVNAGILLAGVGLQSVMSYFTGVTDGADKSNEMLKQQDALIRELAEAWGISEAALTKYDQKSTAVLQRQATLQQEAFAALSREGVAGVLGATRGFTVEDLGGNLNDIRALNTAIATLESSVAAGEGGFIAFEEAMAKLAETAPTPEIRALADRLREQVGEAAQAERNMKKLNATLDGTAKASDAARKGTDSFTAGLEKMGEVASDQIDDAEKLLEIYRDTVSKATSISQIMAANKAYVEGMARIDVSKIKDAMDLIKQEEDFRPTAYWDVNAWRTGFGSDTYVDAMGKVQQVTKDTVVTVEQATKDLERRTAEFQAVIVRQIGPEFWKSFSVQQQAALTSIAYNYGSLPKSIVAAIQQGDQGQVAKAIAALPANPERRKREAAIFGGARFDPTPAKEEKKAFDELYASNQKLLDQEREANLIRSDVTLSVDAQTLAIEKNKIAKELLAAAEEQYGTVSADMRKKIDEQATAMAQNGLQAQKLAESRKADVTSAKEQTEAQRRLNEQYLNIAKTAVSGFINDLRSGKSAGEAFVNVLDRITDGLINMAIEMLFNTNLMKQLFGLGGGNLGGFPAAPVGGGLYHSGGRVGSSGQYDGRKFSPLLWTNAPRFQHGGFVGLRPGEVPIIAHRGELVIPANMSGGPKQTVAGDVYNNQRISIKVDSNGRANLTEGSGTLLGKRLNMAVQEVIAREQRSGGLLAGTGPAYR